MTDTVGFFCQTQGSSHVSAKELPLFGLPALQSLSELRPPKCFHLSPLSGSSSPLGSSQCKEPGSPRESLPQHLALAVFDSTLSALLLLTSCPPCFRRLPLWGSLISDLPSKLVAKLKPDTCYQSPLQGFLPRTMEQVRPCSSPMSF